MVQYLIIPEQWRNGQMKISKTELDNITICSELQTNPLSKLLFFFGEEEQNV